MLEVPPPDAGGVLGDPEPVPRDTPQNMLSLVKPQALTDLMQSIFQTYNPTWSDCCQLLLTLFNPEERLPVIQAATKWLEENAPGDALDLRTFSQASLPQKDPQ